MKWNWGKGIFLTFIIFFSGIALIIIFPFNQKVDLVTENYYKEELLYQDQINKINRANNLSEKIRVEYTNDILKINYPESYKNIKGQLFFYRPSDSGKDFSYKILPDSSGAQSIDVSRLKPGLWKLMIEWEMDGENYFYEQAIII